MSKKPWFKGLDTSDFIRVMCRLMSNHYSLNAHKFRVKLSDSNLCVCREDYEDIEHVVWGCNEHREVRSELIDTLRVRGKQPKPVRDVLASLDLEYMNLIYLFLKRINVRV